MGAGPRSYHATPIGPRRCCGPHNGNWPRGHRALEQTRNTEQPDINQAQPDIEAEHWQHLKTSNPIESTFSTVRLRTRVTKGPGSKVAGLAMAFKLLASAQDRWRAVNGPHLVALVRAGARFERGLLVERPAEPAREAAA
jgi:putative transposase